MPVLRLPRPCWAFTCSVDESPERPHSAVPEWLPLHSGACTDRPYQLDSCCVVVACDGCNTPFDGRCASYSGWHFATVEQALAALADSSWFTDARGRWHCPACPSAAVYAPAAA